MSTNAVLSTALGDDRPRYHAVDLFRFVAAIAVLFYHYTATAAGNLSFTPWALAAPREIFPDLAAVTTYGWLGVELFFLISGFVILPSALGRTPTQFAIARFTRLYPTYWAGVLFTSAAVILLAGSGAGVTLARVSANLTMLQGYLGYEHIDPVYWTLGVELQFYGLVLLLSLLRVVDRPRTWLTVWLVLVILRLLTGQPSKMQLIISPEYSSLFISGAVFYLATREGWRAWHRIMLLVSWMVSMAYVPPHTTLYMPWAGRQEFIITGAIITTGYVLFVLLSLGRLRIPSSPLLKLLGGLTFPLYLVHHMFGRLLIDRYATALPRFAVFAIATSASLVVAYILYRVIDLRAAPTLRRYLTRKL